MAGIIPNNQIQFNSDSVTITGQTLGQFFHLCSKEAYYDEPVAAQCTAFIVGSDIVATAGHCVANAGASRIIFGYREVKDSAGVHPALTIPNNEVFRVTQVLAQKVDQSGSDFALLRVDRPIANHSALTLDATFQPAKGTIVYTLGHPSGLPLKLADNAMINDSSGNGFFTANLDTFGGNSGSPVFSSAGNRVIGILVRGGTDYRSEGTCNRAFVCPAMPDSTSQCGGEAVTTISTVTNELNSVGKAAQPSPPISKTFTSGPVVSGSGANFSPEYQVASDPPPSGYKIGNFNFSLSGDRGCNAWSTCKASIEGDRVVFRFTLQGHNEWRPPGQATSQGFLSVTYVPIS